jgi:hypothetical protein
MDIRQEFENLVQYGLKNKENKKALIQMSSALIASLNSIDKKELSKADLEKISAGFLAGSDYGIASRHG